MYTVYSYASQPQHIHEEMTNITTCTDIKGKNTGNVHIYTELNPSLAFRHLTNNRTYMYIKGIFHCIHFDIKHLSRCC